MPNYVGDVGNSIACEQWKQFHTSGTLHGKRHISLKCDDAACRGKDMGVAGPASKYGCEYCERHKDHKHVRSWNKGMNVASTLGLMRTYEGVCEQVRSLEIFLQEHFKGTCHDQDFTGQTHRHDFHPIVNKFITNAVSSRNKGARCKPIFPVQFTHCLGDPLHWFINVINGQPLKLLKEIDARNKDVPLQRLYNVLGQYKYLQHFNVNDHPAATFVVSRMDGRGCKEFLDKRNDILDDLFGSKKCRMIINAEYSEAATMARCDYVMCIHFIHLLII